MRESTRIVRIFLDDKVCVDVWGVASFHRRIYVVRISDVLRIVRCNELVSF